MKWQRWVLGVVVAFACAKTEAPVAPQVVSTPAAVLPAPKVPIEGTMFRPSLLQMKAGEVFDKEIFEDHQDCGGCHSAVAAELKQSAHALASLSNPVYAMSFSRFAEARGEKNTRFCAGCHDQALLLGEASFKTPPALARSAHLGVACSACHGIVAATGAGNASHVLTTAAIPLPVDGNAASLQAHKERVAPSALRSEKLCASCHRGALTPEMGHDIVLSGLDEWGAWRRSAWAGNQTERIDEAQIQKKSCIDCHMPKVADPDARSGVHASHRFAGGHSMLAGMLRSPDQKKAIATMVQGAATVDVFALTEIPGAAGRVKANEKAVGFDVVIFNEKVGHNFPGGAKDMRDTWVEVAVTDAGGKAVAVSGVSHEKSGREPLAYVLHTRVTDKDGLSQREHDVAHFRTPIYDHTIAPRDAAVVRYAVALPADFSAQRLPLSVAVRLRHRRINLESQNAACAFSKTDLGRRLRVGAKTHRNASLDPCQAQPILEVAVTKAVLTEAGNTADWRRLYRYGLGLLGNVQEGLEEAQHAFERAAKALTPTASPRERAMVTQGLAIVAARQGRLKDALALSAEVEKLLPNAASTAYWIGDAHLNVWGFADAEPAFARSAALQDDDRSLRKLAISLGSQGKHGKALEIAQKGLGLEGRDAQLLRTQLLSYRGLGAPAAIEKRAAEGLRIYERDTEAPHVRDRCFAADPLCQLERTPVAVRWLAINAPVR